MTAENITLTGSIVTCDLDLVGNIVGGNTVFPVKCGRTRDHNIVCDANLSPTEDGKRLRCDRNYCRSNANR